MPAVAPSAHENAYYSRPVRDVTCSPCDFVNVTMPSHIAPSLNDYYPRSDASSSGFINVGNMLSPPAPPANGQSYHGDAGFSSRFRGPASLRNEPVAPWQDTIRREQQAADKIQASTENTALAMAPSVPDLNNLTNDQVFNILSQNPTITAQFQSACAARLREHQESLNRAYDARLVELEEYTRKWRETTKELWVAVLWAQIGSASQQEHVNWKGPQAMGARVQRYPLRSQAVLRSRIPFIDPVTGQPILPPNASRESALSPPQSGAAMNDIAMTDAPPSAALPSAAPPITAPATDATDAPKFGTPNPGPALQPLEPSPKPIPVLSRLPGLIDRVIALSNNTRKSGLIVPKGLSRYVASSPPSRSKGEKPNTQDEGYIALDESSDDDNDGDLSAYTSLNKGKIGDDLTVRGRHIAIHDLGNDDNVGHISTNTSPNDGASRESPAPVAESYYIKRHKFEYAIHAASLGPSPIGLPVADWSDKEEEGCDMTACTSPRNEASHKRPAHDAQSSPIKRRKFELVSRAASIGPCPMHCSVDDSIYDDDEHGGDVTEYFSFTNDSSPRPALVAKSSPIKRSPIKRIREEQDKRAASLGPGPMRRYG